MNTVSSLTIIFTEPRTKEMCMQKLTDSLDGISLNLTLSLSPLISFAGGKTVATTATEQPFANAGPVSVLVDAAIRYDSMSRVATAYLAGKRISISEGILPLHVVFGTVEIAGSEAGLLRLKAQFSGSFRGELIVTGTPVYNDETKTIVLLNPQYQLESKNFLLRGARLLFAKRIEKELKKAAAFSLTEILTKAKQTMDEYLNREWAKGIYGTGESGGVRLLRLKAGEEHLVVQASCEANLRITIDNATLNLHG
jgi:hypothetical protein